MLTSRINLSSVIFISLFIIFNVNQGLSLQCYHCTSNSTGECWTEPTKTHLMNCAEDTNTTAAPSSSTAASTSSSTPSSTSSSTPSSTLSSTISSTSSSSTNAPSAPNSRASSSAAIHNSRVRRSADLRADDDWECVKDITKAGEVEMVTRKCAKKNSNFCNGKDATSCFLCSDKDGCNSASSIGFQFISMVLPLAVALFLAR